MHTTILAYHNSINRQCRFCSKLHKEGIAWLSIAYRQRNAGYVLVFIHKNRIAAIRTVCRYCGIKLQRVNLSVWRTQRITGIDPIVKRAVDRRTCHGRQYCHHNTKRPESKGAVSLNRAKCCFQLILI